jgi:cell division protein ZapA
MPTPNTRQEADCVSVSIYDQTYNLRGHNPAYIEKLAGLVDDRMRAV